VSSPLRLSVNRGGVPFPNAGCPAPRASLRLPSELCVIEEAVDVVAKHCESQGLPGQRARFQLRVALCEALANAIIYGNGEDASKHVDVHVTVTDPAVTIEVIDEGNGYNPSRFDALTLPEDLEAARGRGLFLIRQLVDAVSFNDRGNAICMVLRRA
jgi:serine/threonine-protein kinase RsbW